MPSGKTAYPKIEDNRDGTVTVRYQPTETGLHELHVKYNNESIEGQTIHCFPLCLSEETGEKIASISIHRFIDSCSSELYKSYI